MREKVRRASLLGALALMAALTGCAGPKVVSGATSRGDTVKFAYWQKEAFGGFQYGILECKAQQDGTLQECSDMKMKLKE
jgi:hypothetical protein